MNEIPASEIPEDVMKAATDIAYSAECGVVVGSFPGAIYIARAILAERERCAKVVEDEGITTVDLTTLGACLRDGRMIDSIRNA